MPPSPNPQDLGVLEDRYRMTAKLGSGAMGRVFAGIDERLGKEVAIKVLHGHLASDSRSRKRLLKEARAAAKIDHPNVVQILDFGETADDAVYLVMERLHGRDLHTVVAQEGGLSWSRARAILMQVGDALYSAHEHGIVHRDIKPANCMLVADKAGQEIVKLLDFGIARVDDDASLSGLTGTGELLGTAAYMAPELTTGTPAGPRTDTYAVGCMGYELLAGKPPFSGANVYEILRCHLQDAPVPLSYRVEVLPDALEAAIHKALAKNPDDRFASIGEFVAVLERIEDSRAVPQAAQPTEQTPAGPTGTEVIPLLGGASGQPDGGAVATEVIPIPGHGD